MLKAPLILFVLGLVIGVQAQSSSAFAGTKTKEAPEVETQSLEQVVLGELSKDLELNLSLVNYRGKHSRVTAIRKWVAGYLREQKIELSDEKAKKLDQYIMRHYFWT